MSVKSERLKRLESELQDLQQWLKLGLVPKKDLSKHKEEIEQLEERIQEERERIRALKESGEVEEYAPPKRPGHGRQAFQEPHTMTDVDVNNEEGLTDAGLDMETETYEAETSAGEEGGAAAEADEEALAEEEEEEDPFSDRNRWRRGVLEDPDAGEG